MKLLLVDDSLTMRRILKNVLVQAGYMEVEEVEDGEEALKKLAVALPDLIFLDWNMPNMDGLEFLKRLKVSSLAKKPPVIMVTSVSDKEKIMEAIQAGAADYITKPFTAKIVKEKIEKLLKPGL